MTTVLLTVMCSPENAGTFAPRIADAMQPPVCVPAKGGPLMLALVTRPDGAKVTTTVAVPGGSPSFRQLDAAPAADEGMGNIYGNAPNGVPFYN